MRPLPATVLEAERLGTDPKIGLRSEQVAPNRLQYGENRLPPIPGRSLYSMVMAALNDKTILVLIGAATLALAVEWGMSQLDAAHAPHYIDGI